MEKYNGWENRETWLINLWLSNEETTYNDIRDLLKQKFEYNFQKDEAIKKYVEGLLNLDDEKQLFKVDLLNTSLSRVNWKEVTQSFEDE